MGLRQRDERGQLGSPQCATVPHSPGVSERETLDVVAGRTTSPKSSSGIHCRHLTSSLPLRLPVPAAMVIKAVIFDIGGVVIGSPVVGVTIYERTHGLPANYLNVAITASGHEGAFQRLERGELGLEAFYEQFGSELSRTERNNKAYQVYCGKMKLHCPALPTSLKIDGKDLWTIMMAQASTPDMLVLNAINFLRESGKFKIAALTNNFVVPDAPTSITSSKPRSHMTIAELKGAIDTEEKRDAQAAGAPTDTLKSLFDMFFESAVEGMRKPDPRFYQLALDRLGVKAEEAVFLDDIGLNLIAARKLGINTIRVNPGKSLEAVKELESYVQIPLREGISKL